MRPALVRGLNAILVLAGIVASQAAWPASESLGNVASPLLAIDRNRDTVIDRIVAQWGDALARSNAGIDASQLRALLMAMRADQLLAASLAGSLDGLRNVVAAALVNDTEVRPSLLHAKALGDDNQDVVYVPVLPCRLIETRGTFAAVYQGGGPFAAGEVRSYALQGGNGVCLTQLPPSASLTAVQLQVFGIPTTAASGDIEILPQGGVFGSTATLVFLGNNAFTSAGSTSVANLVNKQISMQVRGGPAHVAVDIVGYFRPPAGGYVKSVTAGAGLTGGTITNTGTIAVDTAVIQARVGGSCAAGSSIRSINADGTVVCEADDVGTGTVTSVGSGAGLTGGPIVSSGTLSADTTYLQRRVSGTCAAGSSIRVVAADGTVTCQADTSGPANAYVQGGNAFGATAILGTSDNNALDVGVNGRRALRLEPGAISPNVLGGSDANVVNAGVRGATIGGGGAVTGSDPAAGNGAPNVVTDHYGTVGGGYGNRAGDASGTTGDRRNATVGGGYGNTASGFASTVGGGANNVAGGFYATVAGGANGSATADDSFVGGGNSNTASAVYAVVVGGNGNSATFNYATIGGGANNVASNNTATIAGGLNNIASGLRSTVSGGEENSATQYRTTVSGGFQNSATADYATVLGGNGNIASGQYSVAGGDLSEARGNHSFALGRRANTHNGTNGADGAFVWADGNDFDFGTSIDNRFAVRATGGVLFVTAINGLGNATETFSINPTGNVFSTGEVTAVAFNPTSDRNAKHQFTPIDPHGVLDALAALPLASWSYRSDPDATRHIGPTAQDFRAAFKVGRDDKSIATVDADGVALAAIQALHARVADQAREIASLRLAIEVLAGAR